LLNHTAQPFHDLSSELRQAIPPRSPASSDDEQTPKNITVFYCKSLGAILQSLRRGSFRKMQLPSAPTLRGYSCRNVRQARNGEPIRWPEADFDGVSVAIEQAGT
jgi:hypothetical protein